MDANQNLTAEMIKIDPYNYTLSGAKRFLISA